MILPHTHIMLARSPASYSPFRRRAHSPTAFVCQLQLFGIGFTLLLAPHGRSESTKKHLISEQMRNLLFLVRAAVQPPVALRNICCARHQGNRGKTKQAAYTTGRCTHTHIRSRMICWRSCCPIPTQQCTLSASVYTHAHRQPPRTTRMHARTHARTLV
jgi:hypothetical protein